MRGRDRRGAARFVEADPKKVRNGLSREIDRMIRCRAAEPPDDFRALG